MTTRGRLLNLASDAAPKRAAARQSFSRVTPVNERSACPGSVIGGTRKRVRHFSRSPGIRRR